jgi:nicotinamidase-related amidase
MQGLFARGSLWAVPWFDRVLPNIHKLVETNAARTIFTRFIPAHDPDTAGGAWKRYYGKWPEMTLSRVDKSRVDLVPELALYVPPARLFDKHTYSPWVSGQLHSALTKSGIDTLIVSGGETDVCVLTTILGAVDHGYRVIVVTDAVCSSSDDAHDAIQLFFNQRLSQQIETAEVTEILEATPLIWQP